MVYKVPFGKQYHTRLGCAGAVLPCNPDGLAPCPVCCDIRELGRTGPIAPARREPRQSSSGTGGTPAGVPTQTLANPATSAKALVPQLGKGISPDALATDSSGTTRLVVVRRIDDHIRGIADPVKRESQRLLLQDAWNEAHPEAPILRWSQEDSAYFEDSGRLVMLTPNFDEAYNRWGQSSAFVVLDKATGTDITDELHHADFALRQAEQRIADFYNPIYVRNLTEQTLSPEGRLAFAEWLDKKRQRSGKRKYHDYEGLSFGEKVALQRQFEKETGFLHAPTREELTPTEEEQRELDKLLADRDAAQNELDAMLEASGFDPILLMTLEVQYHSGPHAEERDS